MIIKFENYKLVNLLATFLIVSFFCFNLIQSIEDIPNADDFDTLLEWSNQYSVANDLSERLKLFFVPHNEHLVVVNRLFAVTSLELLGRVSIEYLLFFANLLFIGCFILLLRENQNLHPLSITSLALLFFQPQLGELNTWATPAISMFNMTFFVILAFSFSLSGLLGQIVAILCATIALLSFAGGIAAFYALAILFILLRQKLAAIFWSISSIIATLSLLSWSENTKNNVGMDMLETLGQQIQFTIALLGSSLSFSNLHLALASGVILILFFLLLTYLGYFHRKPISYAVFCFAILSACLIAYGRHTSGIETAYLTSRYKIYSILALFTTCSSFLDLAITPKQHRYYPQLILTILLGAILFSATSYYKFDSEMKFRAPLLRDSMLRWKLDNKGLLYPVPLRATQILERSSELGIYRTQDQTILRKPAKEIVFSKTIGKEKVFASRDNLLIKPPFLLVDGYAFIADRNATRSKIWLEFVSDSSRKIFPAQKRLRLDVTGHFAKHGQNHNLNQSGFSLFIKCEDIPPDNYKLRVIVKNGEKIASRGLALLNSFNCS